MSTATQQIAGKGVAFEVLAHAPTYDALDEARRLGIEASDVVKTIAIKTRSGHALMVIPASTRLDLKLVHQATGDPHARLENESEIQHEFPAFDLGALPPLGRTIDTPLYVDPQVMTHASIVFAASPTESILVRTDDLLRNELTMIVPLVVQEEGALPVSEEIEPADAAAEEAGRLADPPPGDLRPGHREQPKGQGGATVGYWQVGGASRSAIKRTKHP
ncbi:MAG TPA: YbaK/EbsC family protein [Candidatus Limnocylindrales bacterium]|nr:YbaK/EbsC family protein [Candidatus Limnocylindrales bacterium]